MTTTTDRRTFTPAELRDILDTHAKWKRGESGGARANLAGANLAGADLAGADLARARNLDSAVERADPTEPYVRGAVPNYAARAERYRQRHPEVPVVPNLDGKLLAAVTEGP